MHKLLKSLLMQLAYDSPKEEATPRRLTFEQAVTIANDAAQKAGMPASRTLSTVSRDVENGRRIWCVATSGVGHRFQIVVDDETGEAGLLVEVNTR